MSRFQNYLLIFSTIAIYCECDWVQITQRPKRSSTKQPTRSQTSDSEQYNFPSNEYAFITTPTSVFYKRGEESTSASSISAKEVFPSNVEEVISDNSTLTLPVFDQKLLLVTLEDRMDTADILDSESNMTLTTENFEAVMEVNADHGPTEEPGKARIVTVNNVKKEKIRKVRTEGFIPFLKRVQDELIINGHKNLRWKIGMLRKLRDDMLFNIDDRINQLWGRKSETEARDHKEDDYDMHFPSNEGALITIGFLTFAVFLIKLVLKLVQTLKDKHNMMMVMPTMMTNANAALIGKRKRDTSYAEQSKILQLIEEYSSS